MIVLLTLSAVCSGVLVSKQAQFLACFTAVEVAKFIVFLFAKGVTFRAIEALLAHSLPLSIASVLLRHFFTERSAVLPIVILHTHPASIKVASVVSKYIIVHWNAQCVTNRRIEIGVSAHYIPL